jgi:steroid 5-alpha reductase family enzyme
MLFDMRLPIGLLFLAIGLLVAGYGLSAHTVSTGINIDLIWGSVMAVFGASMLALAALARRGKLDPPSED